MKLGLPALGLGALFLYAISRSSSDSVGAVPAASAPSLPVYDAGSPVIVQIAFRVRGKPCDPKGFTVRVLEPGGAERTLAFGQASELLRLGKGNYAYRQPTDAANQDHAGTWNYWVRTVDARSSRRGSFEVEAQPITIGVAQETPTS